MRSARRRSVTSWYVTTIAPMAGSARRFTATASRSRQEPILWRAPRLVGVGPAGRFAAGPGGFLDAGWTAGGCQLRALGPNFYSDPSSPDPCAGMSVDGPGPL